MHWTQALSAATVAASALAKVAMIHQVRLNWKRKTTAGTSVPFFAAGALSYTLWVASGVAGGSLTLIAGQGPGVVLSAAVAWQWAWYDLAPKRGWRRGYRFSDEQKAVQVAGLNFRTGEDASVLSRRATAESPQPTSTHSPPAQCDETRQQQGI